MSRCQCWGYSKYKWNLYTVVDNSTIAGQINNGNYNLCTTKVTTLSELFNGNTSFNNDIGFGIHQM